MRRYYPAIPLLGTLLLLMTGSVSAAGPPELTTVPDKPMAPDFNLPDTEGDTHRLSDYRGQVVIVNFWAVWCAPCRKEMPSMQRAWEQVRDQEVTLLAVNWGDSEEDIAKFKEKYPVDFPLLLDEDKSLPEQWGVKGLPTTFVVDPEGRLVYRIVGEREWDDPELLAQVLALKEQ